MTDHPDARFVREVGIDRLVALLGHLPENRSDRLDLPLHEQVSRLLDLATAHRPEFRRSIPIEATDHDHLITEVLVKLITTLANEMADRWGAEAERDALADQVDTLRKELIDAIEAFDEATGDHAKDCAAEDIARWRHAAGLDPAEVPS